MIVVRIDTCLRIRAELSIRAIEINLTLFAAFLIYAAYESCRAIVVIDAIRLARKLTHVRLAVGGDATLPCWAVSRRVAGNVALAPGAHQILVAVAVEDARAAHVDLLRRTATDHKAELSDHQARDAQPRYRHFNSPILFSSP
jgi:hypothetical protein